MKMLRLTQNNFIIIDNSVEIKSGDWVYDLVTNTIWLWEEHTESEIDTNKYNGKVFKITHCTNPMEHIVTENSFKSYKYVSLKEVMELIGEIDLYDKAELAIPLSNENKEYIDFATHDRKQWINGYNQCLEDNKDKVYTEKDLRKAVMFGALGKSFSDLIEILQPKTEWEVEFDQNGKLKVI